MKYEMPVLNEKQREKDIATAKEMKNHVEFWGHASGFDAEFLMRCADSYLHSLTAEIVAMVKPGIGLVWISDEGVSRKPESGPLYTSPPVPEMKLPPKGEWTAEFGKPNQMSESEQVIGWDKCLADFKRLNGFK